MAVRFHLLEPKRGGVTFAYCVACLFRRILQLPFVNKFTPSLLPFLGFETQEQHFTGNKLREGC